jgi:hypothetical protein
VDGKLVAFCDETKICSRCADTIAPRRLSKLTNLGKVDQIYCNALLCICNKPGIQNVLHNPYS